MKDRDCLLVNYKYSSLVHSFIDGYENMRANLVVKM